MKCKNLVIVMLISLVIVGMASAQDAMGTAFTYQGRFKDSGNWANGQYDFKFRLYDSGSTQKGSEVSLLDIEASDGYFVVNIDFQDETLFNGEARFLEIDVQPHNGSGYTTLNPRQELKPMPYALHAENGGGGGYTNIYEDQDGNIGIGKEDPDWLLDIRHKNSQQSVFLINEQSTDADYWPGVIVQNHGRTGSNSGHPLFATRCGNGTYQTPETFNPERCAGSLRYQAYANGDWRDIGAIEVYTGLNFSDTDYEGQIHFRTFDGTGQMHTSTIDSLGNFGIGTPAPDKKLTIEGTGDGDSSVQVKRTNGGIGFMEIGMDDVLNIQTNANAYPIRIGDNWAYFETDGDIGIGTTGPLTKANIEGRVLIEQGGNSHSISAYPHLSISTNTGDSPQLQLTEYAEATSAIGQVDRNLAIVVSTGHDISFGTANSVAALDIDDLVDDNPLVTIKGSGNVGIGTTGPSEKLEVAGTIHSNSGGFKFPDGSIQTTSATSAGTGGWTENSTSVYVTDTSKKVGIGTTGPTAKLEIDAGDVSPTARFKGNLSPHIEVSNGTYTAFLQADNNQGYGKVGTLSNHKFQISTYNSPRMTLDTAGNVGIGTTTPAATLDIGGQVQISGINSPAPPTGLGYGMWGHQNVGLGIYSAAGSQPQGISFWVNNGSPMESVRFTSNGMVGIGINNPQRPLDIASGEGVAPLRVSSSNMGVGAIIDLDANIRGAGGRNWQIFSSGSTNSELGGGKFAIRDETIGDPGSYRFIIDGDGEVGIGETDPNAHLHVYTDAPTIRLEDDGNHYSEISYRAGGALNIQVDESDTKLGSRINFNIDGTRVFTTNDQGNTGYGFIGTPSERLDVDGTLRLRGIATGTGNTVVVDSNGKFWKDSSSGRYKKDVRQLDTTGSAILDLEPVRFKWKNTEQEDIGVIAEEVERLLPDLVIYDNEGRPDGVKYNKITLYLLDIVKQQQEALNHQQDVSKQQQETIQQQADEIAELKAGMATNASLLQRFERLESMMSGVSGVHALER